MTSDQCREVRRTQSHAVAKGFPTHSCIHGSTSTAESFLLAPVLPPLPTLVLLLLLLLSSGHICLTSYHTSLGSLTGRSLFYFCWKALLPNLLLQAASPRPRCSPLALHFHASYNCLVLRVVFIRPLSFSLDCELLKGRCCCSVTPASLQRFACNGYLINAC